MERKGSETIRGVLPDFMRPVFNSVYNNPLQRIADDLLRGYRHIPEVSTEKAEGQAEDITEEGDVTEDERPIKEDDPTCFV